MAKFNSRMPCFGHVLLFTLMVAATIVEGFTITPTTASRHRSSSTSVVQYAVDPSSLASFVESSSSLTVAEESWRQYVPLIVCAGVLLDIVLGSPLANMALKPMKGEPEPVDEDETGARAISRSKERIDSEQIAKAALDRASNSLELRRHEEKNGCGDARSR
jgi:hypothetical protein